MDLEKTQDITLPGRRIPSTAEELTRERRLRMSAEGEAHRQADNAWECIKQRDHQAALARIMCAVALGLAIGLIYAGLRPRQVAPCPAPAAAIMQLDPTEIRGEYPAAQ